MSLAGPQVICGVRSKFELDQLSIGNQMIKAKVQDKYLGDILHEGGLKKSVEATISDRYGKTFAAINEIGAVMSDYRIDAIGGL